MLSRQLLTSGTLYHIRSQSLSRLLTLSSSTSALASTSISSLLQHSSTPRDPPPQLLHCHSRPRHHRAIPQPLRTRATRNLTSVPPPNANERQQVSTPPHDDDSWVPSLAISIPGHSASVDPFQLVATDLDVMTRSIRDTVSVFQHPTLDCAASHLLSLKGKRIRPIIVLLMAHATATLPPPPSHTPPHTPSTPPPIHHHHHHHHQFSPPPPNNTMPPLPPTLAATLLPSQLRLAEITELIHAASLLHDDVIDVADTRRGTQTVNSTFGNQLAVLAGDFLLARASVALARLRDCTVVELLSTVIEHLVRGEVLQMHGSQCTTSSTPLSGGIGDVASSAKPHDWYHHATGAFDTYLAKTFFKTASLVANSCRAVTLLAGHDSRVADAAYRFGEDVGMAFQLIDDLLDLTGTADALGKPVLHDVRQGVATAPVLFAQQMFPEEVETMIARCFRGDGDVERVVELVALADGVGKTRDLARTHVRRAVEAIVQSLPPSDHRSALINVADFVLRRQR